MKINLYWKHKEKNIPKPDTLEIPYQDEGHVCSVIASGKLNSPEVAIISPEDNSFELMPRYWFFMNIYWSNENGFEFNQYSDLEISTSLRSNTGQLKDGDKVQINDGLLTLTFRALVEKEDLEGQNPREFLEKCSDFGIRIANIEFSSDFEFDNLKCPNCKLTKVKFLDSSLKQANFSCSSLSNVEFVNSTMNNANFTNSKFSQVEFSGAILTESIFNGCRVNYNKSQIESNKVLVFKDNCDLTRMSCRDAIICSLFENSNLSNADFSESRLVACKFYDCTLNETIFTKSQFNSFLTQQNKSQKQSKNSTEAINCCIQPQNNINGDEIGKKGMVRNCKFDSASMRYTNLSYNVFKNNDFGGADLYKANLYYCEFINTQFNGGILEPAKLASVDISFSTFEQCNLSGVDFSHAKTINIKVNDSTFVRTNFYNANLKESSFSASKLTGSDFRYADLTLLTLDRCTLSGANFFQTKRGGIDLKIEIDKTQGNDTQENQGQNLKSNCTINCIEWSPKTNGEIQISPQSFLEILVGKKSPIAIISNLSKEGAQFILNTYATANAKNAGEDLNDASLNIDGDVDDSELSGGSVETQTSDFPEQEQNEELEDYEDLDYKDEDE